MLALRNFALDTIPGDYPRNTNPTVDLEVLRTFDDLQLNDGSDLVVDLIDLFLKDAPERVAVMRELPAQRQLIKQAAHSLRGSSGNLGAPRLASICEQIERIDWVGRGLESLLAKLELELACVVSIFRAERKRRCDLTLALG